jgi:hypothetical protein
MKTRQKNQARLIGAVTAVALMFGGIGSASAYVAGTIPAGSIPNDGLLPVYGVGTPRDGYFGANLYLVGGPGTITVEYFGAEAGFKNTFQFQSEAVITTPGGGSVWGASGNGTPAGNLSPIITQTVNGVSSGLLNFTFVSQDFGPVVNGSNPVNTSGDVNFFVSFTVDPKATFGQSVDLWLDDAGAGDDEDHDDMMIRLSVEGGSLTTVPLPAAVWLFGSALLGMVGIGTRRARKV